MKTWTKYNFDYGINQSSCLIATRQIQHFPLALTIFIWTSIVITDESVCNTENTHDSKKEVEREAERSFCQTTGVWARQHSMHTIINELYIVRFSPYIPHM